MEQLSMGMSATAGHGAHVGPKSTFSTLPPLTPQSQATRQEQTHQATSNTRHDQAKSGHPPPRTTRRQSSISANLHGVHQSPSAGIKAGNEGVRRLSTAKPNSTKAGAARKRRKKKKAKDQKDTALGAGAQDPGMSVLQSQLKDLSFEYPYRQIFTVPACRVSSFPFPKPMSFVELPSKVSDRREPFLRKAWGEDSKPVVAHLLPQRSHSPDSIDSGLGSAATLVRDKPCESKLLDGACDSPGKALPASVPWATVVFPKFCGADIQEPPDVLAYKEKRRHRYRDLAEERHHVYRQELSLRADEKLRHRAMLQSHGPALRKVPASAAAGTSDLRSAESPQRTNQLPRAACV